MGREGRVAGEPRHHPHQVRVDEALPLRRLPFARLLLRTPGSRLHMELDVVRDGCRALGRRVSHGIGFEVPATTPGLVLLATGRGHRIDVVRLLLRLAGVLRGSLFPRIWWTTLAVPLCFCYLTTGRILRVEWRGRGNRGVSVAVHGWRFVLIGYPMIFWHHHHS